MSTDQKWLAVYVALSRVRNLDSLRSIGLKKNIRKIIEEGPPEKLLAQFEKYCGDKEKDTLKLTQDLGSNWAGSSQAYCDCSARSSFFGGYSREAFELTQNALNHGCYDY